MATLALLLFLLPVGPAAAEVAASTPSYNPMVDLAARLKRVAIELGAGDDAALRDVTDPFMPKGLERLFEWDMRLTIKSEGVGLRAAYLNPPGLKRLTASYRLRFDPFDRAGLQEERDDSYRAVGLDRPPDKRGYGFSLAAVESSRWGYKASYDRTRVSDGPLVSRDQKTEVGVGFSPFGENRGKRWNVSWLAAVDWQELHRNDAGLASAKHGPGFSFGPEYQYGLDHLGLPRKVRPDRLTLQLEYRDSQIHPSEFQLGFDVYVYLTKSLRLTAGAAESWQPRHGRTSFSTRIAVALLLNLRKFSL